MPGQWYPFNGGSEEAMRDSIRKRRAIDCDDLEVAGGHPVSPKRHRPTRNTMSPARKYVFSNTSTDPASTAFGFSQLPFAMQTGPTTSGTSMTFFGSYEQNGAASVAAAMETDQDCMMVQGLLANAPSPKTPEHSSMASNMPGTPEICQQFYQNGYSPSLIDRVYESRRVTMPPVLANMETSQVPDNATKRDGPGAFACRMFPRNCDIY